MASKFSGMFNAADFAYGINPKIQSLAVISGGVAAGAYSISVANGSTQTTDGLNVVPFTPLVLGGTTTYPPITVGEGGSVETVTPTAVNVLTPNAFGATTATATFTYIHNIGDQVRSGTVGLQEAINYTWIYGGGTVVVDAKWAQLGGTSAMISAATVPANVSILDLRFGNLPFADSAAPASLTVLASPTALTTATSTYGMITTATTGGSIPASSTYRLAVTYVDVFGNETPISTDSASTSTIASGAGSANTISISSPAALAGAVGYRVYMTAASGASLSEILYPVGNSAITGTQSQNSPNLASFAIGTPVTITAIITGTATVPNAGNAAYTTNISGVGAAPLVRSYPPFPATGGVSTSATGYLATVNLPVGFLNVIGRTLRIKGEGYISQTATGTFVVALAVASVPGVTTTTVFTITTTATTGTGNSNFFFEIELVTASTGASGTIEAHGSLGLQLAPATNALMTLFSDSVHAVSSAANLTVQDQLQLTVVPSVENITTAQVRQLTLELMQ